MVTPDVLEKCYKDFHILMKFSRAISHLTQLISQENFIILSLQGNNRS